MSGSCCDTNIECQVLFGETISLTLTIGAYVSVSGSCCEQSILRSIFGMCSLDLLSLPVAFEILVVINSDAISPCLESPVPAVPLFGYYVNFLLFLL